MNSILRATPFLAIVLAAGLAAPASAELGVGGGVTVTKTRVQKVETAPAHVCTYEERPVMKTYYDESGGRYEHRTTERVRTCEHPPEYVQRPTYVEKPVRYETQRPQRTVRYSIGLGYSSGHYGHHSSPYFGLGYSSHYPSHSYTYGGYYGSHYRPHNYGHHRPRGGHHNGHSGRGGNGGGRGGHSGGHRR